MAIGKLFPIGLLAGALGFGLAFSGGITSAGEPYADLEDYLRSWLSFGFTMSLCPSILGGSIFAMYMLTRGEPKEANLRGWTVGLLCLGVTLSLWGFAVALAYVDPDHLEFRDRARQPWMGSELLRNLASPYLGWLLVAGSVCVGGVVGRERD